MPKKNSFSREKDFINSLYTNFVNIIKNNDVETEKELFEIFVSSAKKTIKKFNVLISPMSKIQKNIKENINEL